MRLLARLVAATGVAVAAAIPPPAVGAPWTPPAAVPGAPDAFPVLIADARGPRGIAWSELGSPTFGPSPPSFLSPLGPGLAPGAARQLAPAFQISRFDGTAGVGDVEAVDGRGAAVLPASGPPGGTAGTIATGPLGGPFRLRPVRGLVRAVAVNLAGDAAVLVEPCAKRSCGRAAPSVVLGRRGRPFERPVALDRRGTGYGASLAIDGRGRVLAAWDRDGGVYARFISRRGRPGPILRLGEEEAPSIFHVALAGDGRAAVAWASQRVGEGGAGGPFTATLALAGPDGRFGGPRVLGRVPLASPPAFGVPYQGLVVRLPANAPGVVAWTGGRERAYVVRAASITGTRLGPVQTVSTPDADAVLADAAVGSRGQAVLLALPREGSAGLVALTRRAGTASFAAPEVIVAPPEQVVGAVFVDGANVAIDDATGLAFATWRTVVGPIAWSVREPIG